MKQVMPRRPSTRRNPLKLLGDVFVALCLLNGAASAVLLLLAPPFRTAGGTARSRIDPKTGKPVVMRLVGCHPVNSSDPTPGADGNGQKCGQ